MFVNLTNEGTCNQHQSVNHIGVTKDYLVFIYTKFYDNNSLFMKYSEDDGKSWSDSFLIDELDVNKALRAGFFVQPDRYEDNCARFFYSYYDYTVPNSENYFNDYKWIKINFI